MKAQFLSIWLLATLFPLSNQLSAQITFSSTGGGDLGNSLGPITYSYLEKSLSESGDTDNNLSFDGDLEIAQTGELFSIEFFSIVGWTSEDAGNSQKFASFISEGSGAYAGDLRFGQKIFGVKSEGDRGGSALTLSGEKGEGVLIRIKTLNPEIELKIGNLKLDKINGPDRVDLTIFDAKDKEILSKMVGNKAFNPSIRPIALTESVSLSEDTYILTAARKGRFAFESFDVHIVEIPEASQMALFSGILVLTVMIFRKRRMSSN